MAVSRFLQEVKTTVEEVGNLNVYTHTHTHTEYTHVYTHTPTSNTHTQRHIHRLTHRTHTSRKGAERLREVPRKLRKQPALKLEHLGFFLETKLVN